MGVNHQNFRGLLDGSSKISAAPISPKHGANLFLQESSRRREKQPWYHLVIV
jgi:hypothetical protein